MLTAIERAQWRTARDTLDGYLITALDRIMDTAHGAQGKAVKDLIINTIPEVVKAHGTVTAELTAELYALARTNAGLDDLFTPEPLWDPNEQQIAGSLRWSLQPINGDSYTDADYRRAVDRVRASMTRLMRQTESQTVMGNIRRDPGKPRYRRVPEAGACGWCMMLATRGYVYTKETVGGAHNRFHDRCKCSSEPQYPGEELPKLVQDVQKAYDEFVYPNGRRAPAPDGQANFFDFVRDGGLGDRPIPGRDSQGNYRRTIDGQKVPFKRSDIMVNLIDRDKGTGVWLGHVAKFPTGKKATGGHLAEHAAAWQSWIEAGKKYSTDKTLFRAEYSFNDFKSQVRATLDQPTWIAADEQGTYKFRREFADETLEVVTRYNSFYDKYVVLTAYPVAGQGKIVKQTGTVVDMNAYAERGKSADV